jgi:hypothetical protein
MGLEVATYIDGLIATNPTGTDPKSQGDDHLRLVKSTIKNTFPNIAGAVTPTHAEINHLGGLTVNVQTSFGTISDTLDDLVTADGQNVKLTGSQAITGAKQFDEINLGHASDTTLTRVAAGRVAIEGGEIAKLNASQPFTAAEWLSMGTPIQYIENTAAGSDEKIWRWQYVSGAMTLVSRTDANGSGHQAINIRRNGNQVPGVDLCSGNAAQLSTQPNNAAPATTGAQVRHADGTLYDVGLNVMPWVTLGSATLARAHVGKIVRNNSGSAITWTIPASTDTTIPDNSVINFINDAAGTVTIAQGSGVTLQRYDGTGAPATGNRTLSQGGVATLCRVSGGTWRMWGNAGLN